MTRRWVLFALSQMVKSEAALTPTQVLRGCDPLLFQLARRKLSFCLRSAELKSALSDPRHIARVASFDVAHLSFESDFDDAEAIALEYDNHFSQLRPPQKGPWLSVSLTAGLLLSVGLFFIVSEALRPFAPNQTKDGKWMEKTFTELSADVAGGRNTAAREKLSTVGSAFENPQVEKKMRQVVDAAISVKADLKAGEDKFSSATLGLNKAFEQAKMPYFVDAEILSLGAEPSPVLLSFFVQESGDYKTKNGKISVVRLWRLDHLNVSQSKLGYTRADIPYAVVLLDRVEEDLVTQILPAASDNELMSLTDEDTELSDEPWVAQLQTEGAKLIREHYKKSSPEVQKSAARLGALLSRRRSLLSAWKHTLSKSHVELRMPTRLIPEADYSEELHLRVPSDGLRTWDQLHDELLASETVAAFETVREPYLISVERHEVQHRLDYQAERFMIPELLATRLGLETTTGFDLHSVPMRATTELSAYLAQMSEPGALLAMVTMSRMFFSKYTMGGTHSYAALVALESTAQALGIDTMERLGRRVRREELASLMIDVGKMGEERIRAAASKAYLELFSEPPPQVSRGAFHAAQNWRH